MTIDLQSPNWEPSEVTYPLTVLASSNCDYDLADGTYNEFSFNQEEYHVRIEIASRNGLYYLIKELANKLVQGLSDREHSCPDHIAPYDDETCDINNLIELLNDLMTIDNINL